MIYCERKKTRHKMTQTISAPAGNLCVMLFLDTQIKQKSHKMNRGSGLLAAGFFFYEVLYIGIVLLSLYRNGFLDVFCFLIPLTTWFIADPFQSDFPEVVEEYLEHGVTKCISFNRRGTLLAGSYSTANCVGVELHLTLFLCISQFPSQYYQERFKLYINKIENKGRFTYPEILVKELRIPRHFHQQGTVMSMTRFLVSKIWKSLNNIN